MATETATAMGTAMMTVLIKMPTQMPSTADADLMVVCVVGVLCKFWGGNIPPRKQKCPPSH
jgi:hypothetical protein